MDYKAFRQDIIAGVIAGVLPSRLVHDHEIDELSLQVDLAVFDCVLDEAASKNPAQTFYGMTEDTLQ